jgi:bacterioferritin B
MSDLLKVVQRSRDNPLLAEEYLARESLGDGGGEGDPTAPAAAGGAL